MNMFIYQVGILFIMIERVISRDLLTYDMAGTCRRKVEMNSIRDGRVYFHQNGRRLTKCTFELSNALFSYYDFDEIAFHFTEFSGPGLACIHIGQAHLIYTGNNFEPIKGLEPAYCNGTFPDLNTVYTTNSMMALIIIFESQYIGNTSFEFVFNAFETKHYAECKNSYRCDNDRCIPNDVNCNGLNPCGDNSDCKIRERKKVEIPDDYNDSQDESVFGESQYVIVVVIVVAVILMIICVLCGRKHRQRQTVIELPNRPFIANSREPREVSNLARPLPRQTSPQDTQRRLIDDTTYNLEQLDYPTHTVTDLPPSYEDVICNEQKYKLSTNIEHGDS